MASSETVRNCLESGPGGVESVFATVTIVQVAGAGEASISVSRAFRPLRKAFNPVKFRALGQEIAETTGERVDERTIFALQEIRPHLSYRGSRPVLSVESAP